VASRRPAGGTAIQTTLPGDRAVKRAALTFNRTVANAKSHGAVVVRQISRGAPAYVGKAADAEIAE